MACSGTFSGLHCPGSQILPGENAPLLPQQSLVLSFGVWPWKEHEGTLEEGMPCCSMRAVPCTRQKNPLLGQYGPRNSGNPAAGCPQSTWVCRWPAGQGEVNRKQKRVVYSHSTNPGGVTPPFQDQEASRAQIQQQAQAAGLPTLALAGTRFPILILLHDSHLQRPMGL